VTSYTYILFVIIILICVKIIARTIINLLYRPISGRIVINLLYANIFHMKTVYTIDNCVLALLCSKTEI